jgi:hypothetical protein
MNAVVSKRPRLPSVASIHQAKPAPYPGFIEFCDPTLRERAPAGDDWVHEIKTDGYRAQIHIHGGRVIVYSRSGYDWTERFAAIARAAEKLGVDSAIIDGEATVIGSTVGKGRKGHVDLSEARVRPQEREGLPVIQSVPRVRRTIPAPTTAWPPSFTCTCSTPHELRAAVPQAAQGLYLDGITQKSARR